jgi:hypothetical protein
MFYSSPVFVRFRRYGQRFSDVTSGGRGWWLVMAPGIALTLLAVAILIWPQLLAYMVAGALLMVGASLMAWGWNMRRVEQRLQRHHRGTDYGDTVYYQDGDSWRSF